MPVIKYCIWDVGNVIYNYTLEPVHDWCERRTADRETFLRNKGKFSYNNYMKGLVPYAELCRQLCDFYAVPYHKDYAIELNRAFHAGIKDYFPQTRQTQEELQQRGIANCILSNALPILAGNNKAAAKLGIHAVTFNPQTIANDIRHICELT